MGGDDGGSGVGDGVADKGSGGDDGGAAYKSHVERSRGRGTQCIDCA